MAKVHVNEYIGDELHCSGKTVNIYDTYANALAHASTGLVGASGLFIMAPLTGAEGAGITQVAKTHGLVVDENGMIHFVIDSAVVTAGFVYAMITDQYGPPRKITITAA
jgi:hypothetical protein